MFFCPNELNSIYKGWDEVTQEVVRDDQDEKMGRVVPDEMSVLARKVPEPFEGRIRVI